MVNPLTGLLADGICHPAAGVYDALTARIAEHAGFPAAFLSGSAMSYSQLGQPDIGLLSLGEIADITGRICDRVQVPVVVDVDSGFGNPFHVARMTAMLERHGAAAVQMEDQAEVKPVDAPTSRPLVSPAAMVDKIAAAVDARQQALLISARTDALYSEGLAAALDRLDLYLEAGADLLFLEGLREPEQLAATAERFAGRAPLVINLHGIEESPIADPATLAEHGFAVRLFPGNLIRAMTAAGCSTAHGILDPKGATPQPAEDLATVLQTEALLRR